MNPTAIAKQLLLMETDRQRDALARFTPSQLVAIAKAARTLQHRTGLAGLGLNFGGLFSAIGGLLAPISLAFPAAAPVLATAGAVLQAGSSLFSTPQITAAAPAAPAPAAAQPAISPAVLLLGGVALLALLKR